MPTSIGLFGVGLVGRVIAERLAAAGHSVAAHDPAMPHAPAGTQLLPTAGDVFEQAEIVILSLPDSRIVGEVLGSTPARPGQLFIDTTTGTPEDAVAHAELLARNGASYLEATIAGSSELLSKGEAPLFVAGTPEQITTATPLLDTLSSRHFHVGEVGAGARFKLVFNLALGLQRAVLAEALCFAETQGISRATALEILKQTPAYSGVMDTKGERMVEGQFDKPQARLAQHLKDVGIILETGSPTPLSALHHELLERAVSLGFADADNSAIIEAIRQSS